LHHAKLHRAGGRGIARAELHGPVSAIWLEPPVTAIENRRIDLAGDEVVRLLELGLWARRLFERQGA
jgi:hypothetical protein